jgi:hypothetical protein
MDDLPEARFAVGSYEFQVVLRDDDAVTSLKLL